jgi:hypothetical protein
MDGSMNVPAQTSTTLFNGAVPPNAFMVRAYTGGFCLVNDNGPAGYNINANTVTSGFTLFANRDDVTSNGSASFITPPGYKPIGPVSIWCYGATYVAARGW